MTNSRSITSRRLGALLGLSLIASVALVGTTTAASAGKDHFHASGAYEGAEGAGGEGREMRTPAQYEEEANDNPVTGTQSLFSRCRFAPFTGNTGIYSSFASWEHDAIVGDTAFTFADGTSCYNPQNEQNIVINPKNSSNIVTSANEYRTDACLVYVSLDKAQTWTNVTLPAWTYATGATNNLKRMGCGGDPVLAFAPDGTLYFTSLGYNFDKFPRTMSAVAVASSKDGGMTWSKPKIVDYNATGNTFQDKQWLGTGPNGEVYLTWTRFYQGPRGLSYVESPIYISMSKDHGANWTSPKRVSDAAHPYNQGSQVGATPNGTLYVSYEGSAGPNLSQDAIIVARSTDGGTTFTNTEIARVYDDYDCYPVQQPGAQGRQTLTNEQFRINSFPSMAIDPTNGKIAIVWADNQGAGTCGNGGSTFSGTTSNQVKLITSTNGTSWGLPTTITSGAADKVYPSVGANAGKIAVGYYTREFATGAPGAYCGIKERDTVTGALVDPTDAARAAANVCLDWAVKRSDDGYATTWLVSSQSSNPYILFSGSFIGDYTGTAVDADGNVATVWTDFRGLPGVTSPNQDTLVGYLNSSFFTP